MDRILGRPRLVQTGDGADQVVGPLVRVERGEVADHRPSRRDLEVSADGLAIAAGDLLVLDGHAERQDSSVGNAPLANRVGLEAGLDDHDVGSASRRIWCGRV